MSTLIPPAPIGAPFADYSWLDWYQKVRRAINDVNSLNHNSLQNIQGGNVTERYHLTENEYNAVSENGILVLSSDFDCSTTITTNVTDLQFVPEAASTYVFDGYLIIKTSNAASGPRPGWFFSSDVVSGVVQVQVATTTTGAITRYGSNLSTDGGLSYHVQPTVTSMFDTNPAFSNIRGQFTTGNTPVSVGVTLASENTDTVTLLAGSTVILRKVA